MTPSRRSSLLPLAVVTAIGLSACGSEADSAADDASAAPEVAPETVVTEPVVTEPVVTEPVVTEPVVTEPVVTEPDEDHGDEDHGDEDHDDHGDEDHDDHGDEDHDDHGDEDHDDHGDDHDKDDDHDHGDESGGLGAHEHGAAEMSVAWIGTEVAIDLVSPTFNVFGFEYEPTTDEDIAIQADRTDALTASDVIAIDADAGCALVDPVATEVERDGSHSEITVSWLFECENPGEISQVDASGLFAEFPNFEDVDVQWISDSEQSSAELSSSDAVVSLRQ